jgi:hypothetical protein
MTRRDFVHSTFTAFKRARKQKWEKLRPMWLNGLDEYFSRCLEMTNRSLTGVISLGGGVGEGNKMRNDASYKRSESNIGRAPQLTVFLKLKKGHAKQRIGDEVEDRCTG